MSAAKASLVVAVGRELIREALVALLERSGRYRVVASCADGDGLADAVRRNSPQLAILETGLPGAQTLELIGRLRGGQAGCRFVLLAQRSSRKDTMESLRAGASAIVLESGPAGSLFDALDQALLGGVRLPEPLSAAEFADPVDSLSTREYQVFTELVRGVRPKEIAARLGLSVKTVDSHRKKLMEKLGIHDLAGLVKFAIEHGIESAGRDRW